MRQIFLVLLLLHGAAAAVPPLPKWQTLSGAAPLVIARGGFSGFLPESSMYAYQLATSTSLKSLVLFCDLQITKDGAGFCNTNLRLDNYTNIEVVFPKGQKTYNVDGKPVTGWFSVDFTADQLYNNVTLVQSIFSRTNIFDGVLPLATLDEISSLRPSGFWLNVQYNSFFREHRMDCAGFILSASEVLRIDYISSPEISFLTGLKRNLKMGRTKLIFRFLDEDAIEPSTNQTYGNLVKDLTTLKSFASGILVPKTYIWPVNKNRYLEQHTSLVTDAHSLGLEVYAYTFANDFLGSYNYSYDPTAEYLQFIDNSNFSVDGVLTDFPSTASESVACLAHNKDASLRKERPLLISHNGASGVFAGCTDLAYQQAIKDSADVIDCSVQMSKDGVAFCLNSADLMGDTTVVDSFMSRATTVPEIQPNNGIFSFDLTWSEIQSLKPVTVSPLAQSGQVRNPAAKNLGRFVTLDEFLYIAKNSSVSVFINIENAGYLASKKGLGIVDAVSGALTNASYDKQTAQQVFIQSDDSSVLSIFKMYPNYKRVFNVKDTISDTPKQTVDEIKQFADAVNILRSSIAVTNSRFFITRYTDLVDKIHAANMSVFVSTLRNEYYMIALDFFSDPIAEIATYTALGVDGLVTEFPGTASAYFRSPCSDMNAKLPYTIAPAEPGTLMSLAPNESLPPAESPAPVLDAADIIDPPLPPVADLSATSLPPPAASATSQPSGQQANSANAFVYLLLVLLTLASLSCQ